MSLRKMLLADIRTSTNEACLVYILVPKQSVANAVDCWVYN